MTRSRPELGDWMNDIELELRRVMFSLNTAYGRAENLRGAQAKSGPLPGKYDMNARIAAVRRSVGRIEEGVAELAVLLNGIEVAPLPEQPRRGEEWRTRPSRYPTWR